jgi:hypothetical protein
MGKALGNRNNGGIEMIVMLWFFLLVGASLLCCGSMFGIIGIVSIVFLLYIRKGKLNKKTDSCPK